LFALESRIAASADPVFPTLAITWPQGFLGEE
jgi:hypothetical protein